MLLIAFQFIWFYDIMYSWHRTVAADFITSPRLGDVPQLRLQAYFGESLQYFPAGRGSG